MPVLTTEDLIQKVRRLDNLAPDVRLAVLGLASDYIDYLLNPRAAVLAGPVPTTPAQGATGGSLTCPKCSYKISAALT